ncbi:MAG: hypothetical protein JW741_15335 [Sedimentisphaerales bacterium]|nr:hypothetical protein [Sedimentisphaerales bacterium]
MNTNPPTATGKVIRSLAEMPPGTILDETALAAALGCSKRTLRRMVGRFEVPPAIRLASRASWQAGRVLAWIAARAERVEREAERAAARFMRKEPSLPG